MPEPVLEIRGLCKAFGALVVTDNVDLVLRPGEIHALIGPNGAGKSTLIGLVTGALRPDAGQIRLQGRPVDHLDRAARARAGMARSFQVSSVIADFTVLENVLLAAQGRAGQGFGFFRPVRRDAGLLRAAMVQVARVGLADRRGIAAAELSHGERRRLEIAMALALRPRLFLLDEPMAGMGPDGARAMTALLSDLRETAPILLVEHDMDAVFALADLVSVLDGGRIIASGSVARIRADPLVRQSYLGTDA